MIYWRVRFDDESSGEGFLVLSDDLVAVGLFHEDGTPANEVEEYTTIDMNPALPSWAEPPIGG
jgi:hypothetical protein